MSDMQDFYWCRKEDSALKSGHKVYIPILGEPPHVEGLRERIQKLEDALRFYADDRNWGTQAECCGYPDKNGECCGTPIPVINAHDDMGQRAKEALGE